MVCWKIPWLNGGFFIGKWLISIVHFSARHVWWHQRLHVLCANICQDEPRRPAIFGIIFHATKWPSQRFDPKKLWETKQKPAEVWGIPYFQEKKINCWVEMFPKKNLLPMRSPFLWVIIWLPFLVSLKKNVSLKLGVSVIVRAAISNHLQGGLLVRSACSAVLQCRWWADRP